MNDAAHREMRVLLGGYVLGGLSGADRALFDQHLDECEECRDELGRLAPLPGLLGRVDHAADAELLAGPDEVPPSLLERLADEVRARQRTRRLTWGAAAVAAAAAVVALVVVTSDRGPAPPVDTVVAASELASGGTATGRAGLVTKAWGTQLDVELAGMPEQGPFRLVVTGADGTQQVAATWGATPTGSVVVRGATSLPPDTLVRIRVVGPDGPVVAGPVAPVS